MEIPQKISPKKLTDFSAEHLYYEIDMLYGISDRLFEVFQKYETPDFDSYAFNAYLESFILHLSIILDFFYKPQVLNEDAKALHFVKDIKKWRQARPAYSARFRKFQSRRNKDVVHLSYRRLNLGPENKKWDAKELIKEIKQVINVFLEHADPKKVHPKLFELKIKDKA